MGNHTPGPWSIGLRPPNWGRRWEISAVNGACICLGDDWETSFINEGDANASLISAAPDLLEALEQSFDFPTDFFECEETDTVTITVTGRHLAMIKSAIAKARGGL